VEAAVKMHGQGNMALAAVADEAGVSLATVNKHFPTREDLFDACTRHHASNLTYPSPEELAAIPDAGERLYQTVRTIYSLHEQGFGQMWSGYKLVDESPVLAKAVADYEALTNSLADVLVGGRASTPGYEQTARFVRAILSILAYRALRLQGGLDFEEAVTSTTDALAKLLDVDLPATNPSITTL
jgi:AcrR family transcriptional regulator